ncbi:hypothetical protein ID866_6540 [Astraeus odoratus]|nr:hypothetical protein ID866_6540 [Astraeus odoratus]
MDPRPSLAEFAQRATRYSINLNRLVDRDTSIVLVGGQAKVYKGTLRYQQGSEPLPDISVPSGTEVAIKTMREHPRDVVAIKNVLREVHIWSKLSHDNVLKLLGIVTTFDDSISIISEWMEKGNAHEYVQDRDVDPRPLILDIAKGLEYLHGHKQGPIYHGDLKGSNVLIASDGRALLTDFGLSYLTNSSFSFSLATVHGGTIRHSSPENLDNSEISSEGDIWAFGMTVLCSTLTSWNRTQLITQASEIEHDDIVILIFESMDPGTSNFISTITGLKPALDKPTDCTRDISVYVCDNEGRRFVFVVTPDFAVDSVLLERLASWLRAIYQKAITPTGVVCTRRITDPHCSNIDLYNIQIITDLCGNEAADRVRLVTTMWHEVQEQAVAEEREGELKTEHWKSLLDAGARCERFVDTFESAWKIVLGLGDIKKTLLLQRELVDEGVSLENTSVGRRLRNKPGVIESKNIVVPSRDNFLSLQKDALPFQETLQNVSVTPTQSNLQLTIEAADIDSGDNIILNGKSIKPISWIYTRSITDQQMTGAEFTSFRKLSAFCGREAPDRIRLISTMLDSTNAQSDLKRAENDLKRVHWNSFLDAGARYERFHNTSESAWQIVQGLYDSKQTVPTQGSTLKRFRQVSIRENLYLRHALGANLILHQDLAS